MYNPADKPAPANGLGSRKTYLPSSLFLKRKALTQIQENLNKIQTNRVNPVKASRKQAL